MINHTAVSYSCPLCGIVERRVAVPKRAHATIDIAPWLESTIALLATDHATRSPGCSATELQDLRIPAEGIAWIDAFPITRTDA